MNVVNQSMVTYFIIEGISSVSALQTPIFFLVLLLYLTTLGGNLTILLLVQADRNLHTPMYFFLVNLSIIDMLSTTDTLHVVLISFISQNKSISFVGCLTQLYIFASLLIAQLLILTAMSYDRYVAICKPLYYSLYMNYSVCRLLVTVCWVWGFVQFIPHIVMLSGFTCFLSRNIHHFFCDLLPLLKITCSDTSSMDITRFAVTIFFAIFPALLIFIPYFFIILTILRIRSSAGRRKTFYTCSSHLTVLVLLYVTLACQYLRPKSVDSLESNKLFSLFNTAAVPMLNPLIYSLKNKDVNLALRRQLHRLKK